MVNAGINLPPISEPLVDLTTGQVKPSWYQSFMLALLQRTGGSKGIYTSDVQTTASEALTTANTADSLSNSANITANSAMTKATAALASATSITSNALVKTSNLSDLSNAAIARANLGLNIVPITVMFYIPTGGMIQFIPIVQSLTMQANFGGINSYCQAVPSFSPIFNVRYLRGNNQIPIGTLTFPHGLHQCTGSIQPAVNLIPGDVLMITAPTNPDPNLIGVNITFQMLVGDA